MKKNLAFLLVLVTFSQCARVDDATPFLAPGQVLPDARNQPLHAGSVPSLSVAPQARKLLHQRRKIATTLPASTSQERNPSDDSLFSARLASLRTHGDLPDLNEPLTARLLSDRMSENRFSSMVMLSRESFVSINFDNDILDYTDRFYTNGLRIDIIAPVFQATPVRKLFVPYRGSGVNHYGLSLVQNMYTPSTTKIGGILQGDRPYAAYLYLGSFRITNDPARHYRQRSEIDLGIIGPGSYGEWVQRSFHNSVPTNHEPLGWQYQVKNDLVLNYDFSIEKGIVNMQALELMLTGSACAGTLYTNLAGGIHLRTGKMNPYFANLGLAKKRDLEAKGLHRSQFFFYLKGTGKIVGYDATLQGGMIDRSSPYVLPGNNISRFVFQASAGAAITHNGFRLDLEQFALSPEFQEGWWHKWVHVALTFAL